MDETNVTEGVLNFQSKEEYDESAPSFTPFPADMYVVEVIEADLVEQLKYQSTEMAMFLKLRFTVQSLASGQTLVDLDGKTIEAGNRMLFTDLNTESLGFKRNGDPSKARACIAAILGYEPTDKFVLKDVADLEGKKCRVMVDVYTNQKGNKGNKIAKFLKA